MATNHMHNLRERIEQILLSHCNISAEISSSATQAILEQLEINTPWTDEAKRLKMVESAFDQAIDMMFVAGFDGYFKVLNPSWGRELGWTEEELLAKPWIELVHPDDREAAESAIANSLKGKGVILSLTRFICRDGSSKWLSWSATANAHEQIITGVARCTTHRDVTDFYETQRLNRQLASMLDSAPSAISIHDFEGKFLYTNQKNIDLHGYSREELLKLSIFDLLDPEGMARAEERKRLLIERGEASFEVRHYRKDGSILPMELFVKVVEWEGMNAVLSIGTDISDRVKAQERMVALNALLEHSDSSAVIKDMNLRIVAANHNAARAFGYSNAEELLGMSDAELFGVNPQQEPVRTYMDDDRKAQTLPRGQFIVREESVVRQNGEVNTILTRKYPVFNDDGKLIGTGSFSTDISERKQTLDRLEAQNILMSTLLDNLQVGVFMVEAPTGKPLIVNKKAIEILGKGVVDEANTDSLAEVYSVFIKGTNSLYPAQRMPLVRGMFGETSWVDDMEILTPSGSRILLEVQGVPVRDKQGRVVASLANFIDITERIRAHEAVEQERILLRTVIDSIPDAIYVKDTETRKVVANMADCTNLGFYFEADLIGKTDFDVFPNDIADPFYQDDMLVLKHGFTVSNREEKLVKPDGSEWWLLTTKKPLHNLKGEIIGLVGIGRDITQEKIATDRLREAQQFTELILNTVPVRVFWKDLELNYMGCNLPFAEDAGLSSPHEIVGRDDFGLSWNEQAELYRQDDSEVISSGTIKLGYEEPQTTPEGKTIWLRTNKVPLRNVKGEILGVLGTYEDITQSKEAEEKLRASGRIFTHAIDMLCIVGFDGFFKTLNPSWEKILGWSIPELLANPWTHYLHPDDREEAKANLASSTLSTIVVNRFLASDGIYKWLAWNLFSYPEERVIYGVVRDVSEQKLAEVRLKEQNEEYMALNEELTEINERYRESELRLKEQNEEYMALNEELTESGNRILRINSELVLARERAEESDRLKTAFLANMSHEIRTPMNSIIGFSEILLKPNLEPEKQRYFTEIINSACHQLLSVISDVIDIAKIETNQVTLYESELNLNSMLRKTQSIFIPEAGARGVEVTLQLGLPDASSYIITDEPKLMQVINNLVGNANKFTERGTISIGYNLEGQMLKLWVKDSGLGIAPEHHQRIFQRFQQVDEADTRKYGGTGLGLAIAKAFVELFGGQIWLESELGKGSTFYFTIPYKPSTESIGEVRDSFDISMLTFRGQMILVAEDEPVNYMLVEEIFKDANVNLLHAKDGVEAVALFRKYPKADLVLMDIKMPRMNGIDAIKCIRALNPKVPIFALTAFTMAGDKEICLNAGANEYLSKPIVGLELLKLVSKYFGGLNQ